MNKFKYLRISGFTGDAEVEHEMGGLSNLSVELDRCGAEKAEPEDKALVYPADFHSNPHLWPHVLGNNQKNETKQLSFLCRMARDACLDI